MGLIGLEGLNIERNLVVALVPSKLTSIRLPKKNIADFFGNPLFYYSIRVAQLCESITSVYVSSESEYVLNLAKELGSNTIRRPPELSSPEVKNQEVLSHCLEIIAESNTVVPEYVVLLQPTHPFRFPQSIEKGIAMMKEDKEADVLLTVLPHDELIGSVSGNRFFSDVALPRNKNIETKKYFNTGSFYIFRTANTFLKGRMFTDNILPLELQSPEFEIDIDYPNDLIIAKAIMETYKHKFPFFEIK